MDYYFLRFNYSEIRFNKECKYVVKYTKQDEMIEIDLYYTFPEIKENMFFDGNNHIFMLSEVIKTNIPEIQKLKEE